MRGHQRMDLVSSRKQVGAVNAQFIGQMQGRNALRNAAQDLNDGGTAIAGLPPDCAGEEVEDRAALAAAVVGNDWPPSAVRRLICGERVTARTA